MPRRDTRFECEGAEFLVLGELLIRGIPAYKAYRNMPGYDVFATNPETRNQARISVKSRWATDASQFLMKNFSCDFVVIAKLNRGTEKNAAKISPPEFFVLPVEVVKDVPRTKRWNRITFGSIPNFRTYRDRWELIRTFLARPAKGKGRGLTNRPTSTNRKRLAG